MEWKEVSMAALTSALSSGATVPVAPELLPDWTNRVPGLSGAWLYYEGGPASMSTESLRTSDAHARLELERRDGALWKYYRYYYVRMDDGRVFQCGPFKDVDYGHHLNEQPAWVAQYSSHSNRP